MSEELEAKAPEEMTEEDIKKMVPLEHFQPPEHDQLADAPDGEIRGIMFHPDKRLNTVCEVVPEDFDADEMDKLIADMAYTMYSVGGVGLSAIQIGIPLRVFICDVLANNPPPPPKPGEKAKSASQLLVAVNPEIGWTSDEKVRREEGCLSFPACLEHISRPAVVGLRGQSRKGKPFALRAGGMLGRVILHEMDHLDGVSFTERMGAMQKKIVSKKMLRFHRGVRKDTVRVAKR